MRLGLFGGSFDPIHYGHIYPVKEAKEALGIDRVVYLPTAEPPHKPGRQLAPPYARFAMVELALLDEPDMEVSPFELTPDRPAFTIDSVLYFKSLYPDSDLFLIIGADSFAELNTWRLWEEIVDLAELGVLVRPEWNWNELKDRVPREIAVLAESNRVHFLANNPVEVSATQLRQMILDNGEISDKMLPELVLKYARKYSLYR
jgi:nicotinate-nucleotide adenylyltransferase